MFPIRRQVCIIITLQNAKYTANRKPPRNEIKHHQPCGKDISHVVEQVCKRNAIYGRVARQAAENDIRDIFDSACSLVCNLIQEHNTKSYREKIRGIMCPLVIVSTSIKNGITDSTLWCDENGVSQCTARLCTQTTSTRLLIGSTHSMSVRIECAQLKKLEFTARRYNSQYHQTDRQ